jgi:6-phosphogluconolactonase (cycloisomerase 2 family)
MNKRAFFSLLIVSLMSGIGCHNVKQPVQPLCNRVYTTDYTTKERYFYGLKYFKGAFSRSIIIHFKPDSTFLFYACNRKHPDSGRYEVKENKVLLSGYINSYVPREFTFLNGNKIVGKSYSKKYHCNFITICKWNSEFNVDTLF